MKFKINYKIPTISVIISHYMEDLKWIEDYFPDDFNIYIYTKSNEKPNVKRNYIHEYLPNVGRCDHTYLYHIIKHYQNLSDINIFITGSAYSISHKNKCLKSIMNNLKKDIHPTWDVKGPYIKGMRTFKMKNEEWCATDKRNKSNCLVKESKFKNLGEFMDNVIQLGDIHKLIWWGVFLVNKDKILQHKKSFYENIIPHLEYGDSIETSHYMERLWGLIFSNI